MPNTEIKLKIKFTGADARNHRLDFYDAAFSLYGFARALHITMDLFVNKRVIKKATSSKNFKGYMLPSNEGSFEQEIIFYIEQAIVPAIVGGAAYDFIKYIFKCAISPRRPRLTHELSRMHTEYEPYFDKIQDVIKSPLLDAHRVIQTQSSTQISLIAEKDNASYPLVKFNNETYNYLSQKNNNDDILEEHGNITKYNVLTKNGRVYLDSYGHVISFTLDKDISDVAQKLITLSLHNRNKGIPDILNIRYKRILSANSKIVKIIIVDCTELPDTPL